MHAKTDSDVTSVTQSSPTRSPNRPAYYVQSPSRDSHDGGKTTVTAAASSFQSSPTGSPPHSQHSRESSSSRFSAPRKILPEIGSGKAKGENRWKDFGVIEEEGLLDDGDRRKGFSRRCYALAFVVGFLLLFSFFSLILWGASKPQKPKISMKSITFEELNVQAGSDSTGVETDMITMNATIRMLYRNTGTFFGVHVTSSPVDLSLSQIRIATGSIKKFHQSRKSQKTVLVNVIGNKIPLYGSGSTLTTTTAPPTTGPAAAEPVEMKLSLTVRTRANVLGKLVKHKFYKTIECDIPYNPKKLNVKIPLKNKCTYV